MAECLVCEQRSKSAWITKRLKVNCADYRQKERCEKGILDGSVQPENGLSGFQGSLAAAVCVVGEKRWTADPEQRSAGLNDFIDCMGIWITALPNVCRQDERKGL